MKPRLPILTSNPVDRAAPLNRGLVAWWAGLPHLAGGPAFYDLTGAYPATFAGVDTWGGIDPTGFTRVASGTGATGYLTTNCLLPPAFTIALSFANAVAFDNSNRGLFAAMDHGNNHGLYISSAGSTIALWPNGSEHTLSYSFAATTPYRLAVTYDGTTMAAYVNGAFVTSFAATVTATTTAIQLGRSTWNGDYWDGTFWSYRLSSVPLSAAEVAAEYGEYLAGFPTTLSRVTPTLLMMGASSGSASGAGSASGSSSGSGAGASIAASAGSAAGASSASGAGAEVAAGAGSAPGSASASGASAATASGAGSAAGGSTASGAGASVDAAAGTAAGSSVASGGGSSSSAGSGAGTASGSASAAGVGASIDAASGSAAGSSSATAAGGAIASGAGSATGTSTAVAGGSDPGPTLYASPAWWWPILGRRRRVAPASALVIAGWTGVELDDPADPWGIDPGMTTLEN